MCVCVCVYVFSTEQSSGVSLPSATMSSPQGIGEGGSECVGMDVGAGV